METAFSNTELIILVISLIGSSIVAGIIAGLLGVGGGIILVPVMFWLFSVINFPPELSMHMAVATSLATIIATSISSARAHHKKGAVDFDLLKRWIPGMALGALSGGLLAGFLDPSGLRWIFGIVALLVALNLAIPKTLTIAHALPANTPFHAALSYIIGLISSLMGIGGGTLSVPTLAAFSYPIHRAVGTAAAFGLVIAIPAVLGFIYSGLGVPSRPPFSLGYVNLAAAAIILPFTVYFAPFGARLAHRLDGIWVKRAFALFLTLTAIKMLTS